MCSQGCSHVPQEESELRKCHYVQPFFSPVSQGGSVNKPTISPITGPSQLSFSPLPSSLLNMFLRGTLYPFLCTNGAACFCYVETCEQLNLMATFLQVCLNRLPKQVLHPGSRKPPAFFSDLL